MVATRQFSVKGMTCENCVRHVEKALQTVPGVSSVTVNLNSHQVTIAYDPAIATTVAMTAAVSEAGYRLEE